MAKRMLIDSTHAEETRVVVMNGQRLEEFDVETSTKKQLKGNIYLAKIVRVEPSLQAAFVEYGGNRHGFLAFSEIHPDYYQIPHADRQALLAEQREVMRQSAAASSADFGDDGDDDDSKADTQPDERDDDAAEAAGAEDGAGADTAAEDDSGAGAAEQPVQAEILPPPRRRSLRSYKIQEVIKRRQIILVQVVKEERGNKGAALTTYLSLAGRYCVLMPNTARGGGVSRKITNAVDRKRLKAIANDMDIPDGMAVIIRTAGSERTKPEILRDYEYLLRLWDSIRQLTFDSVAPSLVYEEANLIKRAIRDLYSHDIEEIQVEGEQGYVMARDVMRMLTPGHARRVQLYRDQAIPLFQKFQVEPQLDAMHSPVVQLRSGGYLVINQTEALVAIDVNSGRSTKERHIEETALKTNLEAAEEVARQLRLRDLAGLIVIDFIDMEEQRNNHMVERRLKEAMRTDRARIQLGKISGFGLMELSRQRLRPSLMETSFQPCPHCGGTGMVRSVESSAMHILRLIEEEGIRRRSTEVTITVSPQVALYILNQKRATLTDIEYRYNFRVYLLGDETLIPPNYRMDRIKADGPVELPPPPARPQALDVVLPDDEDEDLITGDSPAAEPASVADAASSEARSEPAAADAARPANGDDERGGRSRRRRRRRRGRRDDLTGTGDGDGDGDTESDADGDSDDTDESVSDTGTVPEVVAVVAGDDAGADSASADDTAEDGDADGDADAAGSDDEDGDLMIDGDPSPRRRRRGKRGGRRSRRRDVPHQLDQLSADENGEPVGAEGAAVPQVVDADSEAETAGTASADAAAVTQDAAVSAGTPAQDVAVAIAPAPEAGADDADAVPPVADSAAAPVAEDAAPAPAAVVAPQEDSSSAQADVPAAKPRRTRTRKPKVTAEADVAPAATPAADAVAGDAEAAPARPKRTRAPRKPKMLPEAAPLDPELLAGVPQPEPVAEDAAPESAAAPALDAAPLVSLAVAVPEEPAAAVVVVPDVPVAPVAVAPVTDVVAEPAVLPDPVSTDAPAAVSTAAASEDADLTVPVTAAETVVAAAEPATPPAPAKRGWWKR